jgi:hypothetical protein
MKNREIAQIWMAEILARLYDAWPEQTTLKVKDTIDVTGITCEKNEKLWSDLGQWLEAEDLIRRATGTLDSVDFRHAVLTARGSEILGKPVPPGTETTLGTQLGEVAKDIGKGATKEGATKAVADLVGTLLGSMIKSAGS